LVCFSGLNDLKRLTVQ
jgi:hypothetical protein